MAFSWIREQATWDETKAEIIGAAPKGVFDRRYNELAIGDVLPGEWWRVDDDGRTVGFGWMDVVWGDAEILLATSADAQGRGVGSFIIDRLVAEARNRGLNYLYNTVRPTHPRASELTAWLEKRGFTGSEDGTLVRVTVL
jgi:GNAT superfamily N-acetyltransferase